MKIQLEEACLSNLTLTFDFSHPWSMYSTHRL